MSTWKISGVVLCLFLASIIAAQQQRSAVVVIQGATVIPGTGRPAIRNAAIVIDGGRIRDIGPRNEVRVPGNAQMIDGQCQPMSALVCHETRLEVRLELTACSGRINVHRPQVSAGDPARRIGFDQLEQPFHQCGRRDDCIRRTTKLARAIPGPDGFVRCGEELNVSRKRRLRPTNRAAEHAGGFYSNEKCSVE